MKLENERYEVTFTEKGGEIASFTDKQTGIQYMYQGNTDFWGGKNPTLFPMVDGMMLSSPSNPSS